MDHAEQLARNLHALLAESQSWPAEYDPYRPQFQAQVDRADADFERAEKPVRGRGGELIADVFRRQAADMKLTRAQALRQAMMGLLDGPGFVDDSGKALFTYAQPLFWAPYSIIGDGGT
jgi:hypothetical protein